MVEGERFERAGEEERVKRQAQGGAWREKGTYEDLEKTDKKRCIL